MQPAQAEAIALPVSAAISIRPYLDEVRVQKVRAQGAWAPKCLRENCRPRSAAAGFQNRPCPNISEITCKLSLKGVLAV